MLDESLIKTTLKFVLVFCIEAPLQEMFIVAQSFRPAGTPSSIVPPAKPPLSRRTFLSQAILPAVQMSTNLPFRTWPHPILAHHTPLPTLWMTEVYQTLKENSTLVPRLRPRSEQHMAEELWDVVTFFCVAAVRRGLLPKDQRRKRPFTLPPCPPFSPHIEPLPTPLPPPPIATMRDGIVPRSPPRSLTPNYEWTMTICTLTPPPPPRTCPATPPQESTLIHIHPFPLLKIIFSIVPTQECGEQEKTTFLAQNSSFFLLVFSMRSLSDTPITGFFFQCLSGDIPCFH